MMSKTMMCSVVVVATLAAGVLRAQVSKTIQGEMKTVTVTVEAIEKGSREVTVKKPDGNYDVLYVPRDVKRFDTLKIGDKITARYYENMVLQLKAPGQPAVDTASGAVTKNDTKSAGTAAHQRTITATITEIDQKVPSITFTGPHGWTYSSRVEDKAALAKVKVGDKVDITWTTAVTVSIDDSK
jgi:Cu/Ag efflux protein CusF